MTDYTCAEPDCTNTSPPGVLYRISPKGKPFVGKCPDHYTGKLDPIVQMIAGDPGAWPTSTG